MFNIKRKTIRQSQNSFFIGHKKHDRHDYLLQHKFTQN